MSAAMVPTLQKQYEAPLVDFISKKLDHLIFFFKPKIIGTWPIPVHLGGAPIRPDLAKRRQGTACSKTRAEVRGGGKKPWRQKGTGRARAGSIRSPLFKGGGAAHGPKPRDYSFKLPKKVRRLALRSVIATKLAQGKLFIIKSTRLQLPKTREIHRRLMQLWKSVLVIDGPTVDPNFERASRNLKAIDYLPQRGINVYDVMRRDILVLSRQALAFLAARLSPPPSAISRFAASLKHAAQFAAASSSAAPEVTQPPLVEGQQKAQIETPAPAS